MDAFNAHNHPEIMDWTCTVRNSQRLGNYSLLISDITNRTYILEIGALLCGMHVRKDGWQSIFDDIGPGSKLKFRVFTSNFVDYQNSAITIVSLNSYTPKHENFH